MDYNKIGTLIAVLRKEKCLTQLELANKLGITDRAVSKWERGLGCPDISLLDDLSRILDISILEILKGRRLDKDEIVNNESIIESMTYSKEHFKYRLKKYFNIVCVFVVVMIIAILFLSNLKSIYYLNKTYKSNYGGGAEEFLFADVKTNIERIKKDRGLYNESEYRKIMEYINKLEDNLKQQNNVYYFDKKYYTYSELVKFYNSHQSFFDRDNFSKNVQEIYGIVHNYDPSVISNVVTYYAYTGFLTGDITGLFKALKGPYSYSQKVDDEIAINVQSFINFENRRNNMLLEDIIKVGDINE